MNAVLLLEIGGGLIGLGLLFYFWIKGLTVKEP